MDPFHTDLARIGLSAAAPYQFALAGGYAVAAHGMTDRPSEDVDLFTNDQGGVPAAKDRIVDAYQQAGYTVEVDNETEHFARLLVNDAENGRNAKVELGVDWRAHAPVILDVGPVLHPDDAVANKMTAVFGRWQARDFIDVDGALTSNRYTRAELLRLAAEHDPGFSPAMFADALARLDRIPDARFGHYGVSAKPLAAMRARFAGWHTEITAPSGPGQEVTEATRLAAEDFPTGIHERLQRPAPAPPSPSSRPPGRQLRGSDRAPEDPGR